MEQNKGRSRARRIVIILLAAVMLISGGLSLHSYLEDKRTQEAVSYTHLDVYKRQGQ